MTQHGDADTVPASYASCARAYAPDLLSTLVLFVSASFLAGRVWRFPFDDEIYTLTLIERQSARALLTVLPATQDVHPPLSYLVFRGLRQLGLTDAGMRLCSLAMTALALLLVQILVLAWIAGRERASVSPQTRLIAVLMFGLMPIAVSQGDALRWYPLFALQIALFVTLYLAPRRDASRLWSAAALGVAGSTNFLALLMVPALIFYRYALQRRFRWPFDLTYWLLTGGTAVLGFYTAYWVLAHRLGRVDAQFGGVVKSLPLDLLGFFGGDALGLSQAWLVAPTIAIFAVAMVSAIDRKEPANPAHLLLLMLAATAAMVLAGFAKPRSFLYLAPVIAALLTLYFNRQARQRHAGRTLTLVTLVLALSVSAIANINFGAHPFKRNSVIPYQSILDFIHGNANGSALIISTDPVVPWVLRPNTDAECAGYFMAARACLAGGRRYDSIFVISGHSNRSGHAPAMANFQSLVAEATAGRTKVTSFGAGLDEDAALKSRLSGVPLDRYILTVDYYR
jgi:hypothetical protein